MHVYGVTTATAVTFFLLKGGCIRLEGVDDAENFSIVGKAFDTIGMSKELQDQVHAHTI
jgi:myosin heavy subunit